MDKVSIEISPEMAEELRSRFLHDIRSQGGKAVWRNKTTEEKSVWGKQMAAKRRAKREAEKSTNSMPVETIVDNGQSS